MTGSRTRETSQAGDKESRRDRSPVRAGSKELPRVQNLNLSAVTNNGDDAAAKGSREVPVEVAAVSAAKLTNGDTTTEAGHKEEGKGDLEEINGAVAAEETSTTGGEGRLATWILQNLTFCFLRCRSANYYGKSVSLASSKLIKFTCEFSGSK